MELTIRTKTGPAGNVYRRLAAVSRQFAERSRALMKAASRSEVSASEAQIDSSWARWRCEQDVLGGHGFGGSG